MAKEKLSAPRKAILEFITSFIDQHGYPPTVREITRGCGISSTSVVDYHLNVLARDGHLVRDREVSRGLRIEGQILGDKVTTAARRRLSPTYDRFLDFVIEKSTPQEILAFELTDAEKRRAIDLLDKQYIDALTPKEAAELEQMRHFESMLVALKARAQRASR